METPPPVSEEILDAVVERITEAVHPTRIILFGSAARGEMGADSDLDLLVVMPDGTHRRQTAQTIYRCLAGLGMAKDVVVVTEADVRDYAGNPSLVLHPALREGREIYVAGE
jgi:predicted nucleotidyltransferase